MEVKQSFLAADALKDSRGRYIVVGMFCIVRSGHFPFQAEPFIVGVIFGAPREIFQAPVPLKIVVEGGTGESVLMDDTGAVNFGPSDSEDRLDEIEALLRIEMNAIVFPTAGLYRFTYTIDERLTGTAFLEVRHDPRLQ